MGVEALVGIVLFAGALKKLGEPNTRALLMVQTMDHRGIAGPFIWSGDWPELMDEEGLSPDELPAAGALKECTSSSLLIRASPRKGFMFRHLHKGSSLNLHTGRDEARS